MGKRKQTLERGYYGEQRVAFTYYNSTNGWIILRGPSGSRGKAANAPGEDLLAFNTKTRELHIVDNKAYTRKRSVSKASAIDPSENLLKNLDRMVRDVQSLKRRNAPMIKEVLSLLQKTKTAIANGRPIPSKVKLVVTNAGGKSHRISKRLAQQGVEFIDVNQSQNIPFNNHPKKLSQYINASYNNFHKTNYKFKAIHARWRVPKVDFLTVFGKVFKVMRIINGSAEYFEAKGHAVSILAGTPKRFRTEYNVLLEKKKYFTQVERSIQELPALLDKQAVILLNLEADLSDLVFIFLPLSERARILNNIQLDLKNKKHLVNEAIVEFSTELRKYKQFHNFLISARSDLRKILNKNADKLITLLYTATWTTATPAELLLLPSEYATLSSVVYEIVNSIEFILLELKEAQSFYSGWHYRIKEMSFKPY